MIWVALFSQSGKELYRVCDSIQKFPNITLTNNKNTSSWYEDTHKIPNIRIANTSEINNTLISMDNLFITMHGYTRILPNEIVEKHRIFNGHPGDIIKYPELKGKDPQQKAFDLKLPSSGTVIHRATTELDGGDIYRFKRVDINPQWSYNDLCDHLRSASIELWCDFLLDEFVDKEI